MVWRSFQTSFLFHLLITTYWAISINCLNEYKLHQLSLTLVKMDIHAIKPLRMKDMHIFLFSPFIINIINDYFLYANHNFPCLASIIKIYRVKFQNNLTIKNSSKHRSLLLQFCRHFSICLVKYLYIFCI